MSGPVVRPYGTWPSPITAQDVAAGGVRLGQVVMDGHDIYWVEGRPGEAGRNVVVRWRNDERKDITGTVFNVRTRVHEYGGGAFTVAGETLVFSNDADGRLYVQAPGTSARPMSPADNRRYADVTIDRERQRVICVQEDHRGDGEPANTLVAVPLDGGEPVELFGASDFVSSPRLSPDGARLAWLSWNHPNMPWDGCDLWLAELSEAGMREEPLHIAGGADESIFQPLWSPDGTLYFVSDRSGWWNLYRVEDGDIQLVFPREAEFGLPQWVFGMSTYAFAGPGKVICTGHEEGQWRLWQLDTASLTATPIATPYTEISDVQANEGVAAFTAGSPSRPEGVVRLEVATNKRQLLSDVSGAVIPIARVAGPQPITFPTGNGLSAHAFFYPPANPDHVAPDGELPPLIVESHGGPTGGTSTALRSALQFWTSRGFAVLDVDYGGSTGYGRRYRERLDGAWGVVDVDDCVNGARFLVEQGRADPARLIIRGSSASGYTTLAALTFRDSFRAGASRYGISDLEAMATETHKFESRYLDRLIGPYPAAKSLYEERSPIHHIDQLACAMIVLQGLEDKVVPPNQAEMIVEAVRAKGLPVAYVPFEGEQHGFRRAETIIRALESELSFYGQVFGFDPAGEIEPVEVANLRPHRLIEGER
ncbi:MAG: S9 family peptidase [Thermomicrobiales bacterium]